MTKGEALALVASHVAGNLSSGDLEEATGLFERDVSEADQRRLLWAIDEVCRRLYNMGTRQESTAWTPKKGR